MKTKKKKLVLIVLVALIIATIISKLPTRSGFFFAREEERRQIDEFYTFQPEMISEGNFFDLKLLTPYTMTPRNISSPFYMWLSILKKVDPNMKFSMEIEFFYQGEKIEVDYMGYNDITFDNLIEFDSMRFSRGNSYYYPNFFIWILQKDVDYLMKIDEIEVTISYFWGKETHRLKFDADSSERLVNDLIKSNLENPNVDDGYIREFYKNFNYALLIYDFERWYISAEDTIDKCVNEKDELSCYVIKNLIMSSLTPRQEEVLLSSDQVVRIHELYDRYDSVKDALRAE